MQVTGWGIIEDPLYDKNNYLLNNPKSPNQLKVAYVEDYTHKKDDTGPQCGQNTTEIICVFNGTLVQRLFQFFRL